MNKFIENIDLNKLTHFFDEIMIVHNSIIEKKKILNENLDFLRNMYNELIKQNTKQMFVFCLDSFYFQYKMLNTEMQHINYFISIVNNRMYGDYYKLYHIMLKQLKDKGIEIQGVCDNTKLYPPYKDLDSVHEYVIENINKLHNEIIDVLTKMNIYYLEKDIVISKYKDSTKVGISITNFINTLIYDNSLLREHIILYYNYVEFFHNIQYDHLKSINNKITQFYIKIKDDIIKNQRNINLIDSDIESILSINLDNKFNINNNYPKTPKNSDISSSIESDYLFSIDNNLDYEIKENPLYKVEIVQNILMKNNEEENEKNKENTENDSISTISSLHK